PLWLEPVAAREQLEDERLDVCVYDVAGHLGGPNGSRGVRTELEAVSSRTEVSSPSCAWSRSDPVRSGRRSIVCTRRAVRSGGCPSGELFADHGLAQRTERRIQQFLKELELATGIEQLNRGLAGRRSFISALALYLGGQVRIAEHVAPAIALEDHLRGKHA